MNALGLGNTGTPTTTNSGGTANDISSSVLANSTPANQSAIDSIVASGPSDTTGGTINGVDLAI
jgi:hypothetical protein